MANLRRETKKRLREKAEQGIWPSIVPLGYLNARSGERNVIDVDPLKGPLITKCFNWYTSGKGMREVAPLATEEASKKASEEAGG